MRRPRQPGAELTVQYYNLDSECDCENVYVIPELNLELYPMAG